MPRQIIIDPSRCTACRACETACSLVKTGTVNPELSRIRVQQWKDDYFYYPLVCAQCEIPYCALACPTEALEKNHDTGWVDFFPDKCIGCKMCVTACPFGAITMEGSKAAKCDLCGGDPTCVKFCEPQAIRFGEPEELAQEKRLKTALRFKEAFDHASRAGVA